MRSADARDGAESSAATAERDLLERVRAGDEAAFRDLYETYFPRVYQFVDRRVRNRADTEEVVQEIFINVFSSLHSYRGEAPFAAWVFGLARRTLANRFKRLRHPTVSLPDDEAGELRTLPHLGRSPDPHELYEFQERLERIQQAALHDLSEEQWELFRLHHLQHHSIRDIARRLRKTQDSVKSHLYRARKLLLTR